MAKIVDYTIIEENDKELFVKAVKRLLADGWSIYGDVAHGYTKDSISKSRFVYSRQALVKYD